MAKSVQQLEKPVWLKVPGEEVEALVVKLGKEGNTSEKIGLILRDQYGIPSTRIYGKKVNQILKENGIHKDTDLIYVEKKLNRIKAHLQKHHNDKKSKRALDKRTGKFRKLTFYGKKRDNKK